MSNSYGPAFDPRSNSARVAIAPGVVTMAQLLSASRAMWCKGAGGLSISGLRQAHRATRHAQQPTREGWRQRGNGERSARRCFEVAAAVDGGPKARGERERGLRCRPIEEESHGRMRLTRGQI
jgi:hypothetical protein